MNKIENMKCCANCKRFKRCKNLNKKLKPFNVCYNWELYKIPKHHREVGYPFKVSYKHIKIIPSKVPNYEE